MNKTSYKIEEAGEASPWIVVKDYKNAKVF